MKPMKRIHWMRGLLFLLLCSLLTSCTAPDYQDAKALEKQGNYEEALALYETFLDYKDSSTRAANCEAMLANIRTYNSAVIAVKEKNAALEQVIAEAQGLLANPLPVLDSTLYADLTLALEQSSSMVEVPTTVPRTADQLQEKTAILTATDYSSIVANIDCYITTIFQNNLQYELVNVPSETYVIVKLKSLPTVIDTAAVTERTDPEGSINTEHGYVSAVYFSSNLLEEPLEQTPDLPPKQHEETIPNGLHKMEWLEPDTLPTQEPLSVSELAGLQLIEQGVKAGGCIETFRTPEDAHMREDYLATLDGTKYDQGSHKIVGTVLIRTSSLLTQTQQKDLEQSIISVLTSVS